MTILSERLKLLRTERNKSQKEVSLELDLKPSALSNYENGEREPNIGILNIFAKYYSCSVDFWLVIVNLRPPKKNIFVQE